MNALRNFLEQLRGLDARDVGRWPFLFRALAQGVKKDATALLTACGLALRSFD